jgi:hypothetical protein
VVIDVVVLKVVKEDHTVAAAVVAEAKVAEAVAEVKAAAVGHMAVMAAVDHTVVVKEE